MEHCFNPSSILILILIYIYICVCVCVFQSMYLFFLFVLHSTWCVFFFNDTGSLKPTTMHQSRNNPESGIKMAAFPTPGICWNDCRVTLTSLSILMVWITFEQFKIATTLLQSISILARSRPRVYNLNWNWKVHLVRLSIINKISWNIWTFFKKKKQNY